MVLVVRVDIGVVAEAVVVAEAIQEGGVNTQGWSPVGGWARADSNCCYWREDN